MTRRGMHDWPRCAFAGHTMAPNHAYCHSCYPMMGEPWQPNRYGSAQCLTCRAGHSGGTGDHEACSICWAIPFNADWLSLSIDEAANELVQVYGKKNPLKPAQVFRSKLPRFRSEDD